MAWRWFSKQSSWHDRRDGRDFSICLWRLMGAGPLASAGETDLPPRCWEEAADVHPSGRKAAITVWPAVSLRTEHEGGASRSPPEAARYVQTSAGRSATLAAGRRVHVARCENWPDKTRSAF